MTKMIRILPMVALLATLGGCYYGPHYHRHGHWHHGGGPHGPTPPPPHRGW